MENCCVGCQSKAPFDVSAWREAGSLSFDSARECLGLLTDSDVSPESSSSSSELNLVSAYINLRNGHSYLLDALSEGIEGLEGGDKGVLICVSL